MPAKAPTGKGPLGVLKKKIGPAPLWVWFAVGLLLFVVYRRFSSSANNTGATPVVPQTAAGTPMDSSGTSGGGGSASGAGMNVDPNQLLDAYRAGGSDYSNLFNSMLPYFYYGSGSTDYGATTPMGSNNPVEGAQNQTQYIAQQQYEGIDLYRQPYHGDILLKPPSPGARKVGGTGELQYGIQGGGGTQPKFQAPPGSPGIFLFK